MTFTRWDRPAARVQIAFSFLANEKGRGRHLLGVESVSRATVMRADQSKSHGSTAISTHKGHLTCWQADSQTVWPGKEIRMPQPFSPTDRGDEGPDLRTHI